MEDPGTVADILAKMSAVAPLTESDAEQLHQLLAGVKASADRMAELAPVFPAEVDPGQLSTNVDGDDGS